MRNAFDECEIVKYDGSVEQFPVVTYCIKSALDKQRESHLHQGHAVFDFTKAFTSESPEVETLKLDQAEVKSFERKSA